MSEDRLYRVDDDEAVWMGVLGGIAKYTDNDPAFIRYGFSVVCLLTGVIPGLLAYMIAVPCIPRDPEPQRRRDVLAGLARSLRR